VKKIGVANLAGFCKGATWVRPITPVELYTYARSITLLAGSGALVNYLGNAVPPSASGSTTSATTPAPGGSAAPAHTAATSAATSAAPPFPKLFGTLASNAWAIGPERSEKGEGMLLANPHFPWEGPNRFWEVHLKVPGKLNVYGAQLTGVPLVGVGFNENIAWTHTVAAGNRFTVYKLSLLPGDPTSYVVDGEPHKMASTDATVEVLNPDGSLGEVHRTLWSTQHGPVLNFPGVGWTDSMVLDLRDANINNRNLLRQYLAMNQASSMKAFQAAHERYLGIPLFNTIATSREGTAWFAQTPATPNLSPEALAAYAERLKSDPLTSVAANSSAVVLDGSTSRDEWVDAPGSRDPGLIPFDKLPQLERNDYVFNANDSFWLANPEQLLEGDYSPLLGPQRTERSARTRENALVLMDTTAKGPSGADGKFSDEELRDAALRNAALYSDSWLGEVLERCSGTTVVDVEALTNAAGAVMLPADAVDIAPACEVLSRWDGRYNADSRGAVVWREFRLRLKNTPLVAFDPADPVNTPSGLAPPPATGPDPVLVALARSVQTITKAGFAIDAPLGEVQVDGRGSKLPIAGGTGAEGLTNVVDYDGRLAALDPTSPVRPAPVAEGSSLTPEGYWINSGTSFLMQVSFSVKRGPSAMTILTYGQTDDRASALFTTGVKRFTDKKWKLAAFKDAQVAAESSGKPEMVSAPRP
jgi:acyl-homoserine-lactone acylase